MEECKDRKQDYTRKQQKQLKSKWLNHVTKACQKKICARDTPLKKPQAKLQ